jgi:hypothetical protein
MLSPQKKWLARIESTVLAFNDESLPAPADPPLEVLDQANYANVGTLLVQQDLETLVEMTYDFQSASASFVFAKTDDGGRQQWAAAYRDGDRFRNVLAELRRRIVAQIGDGTGCDHSDARVCQGMGHAVGPDAEPS